MRNQHEAAGGTQCTVARRGHRDLVGALSPLGASDQVRGADKHLEGASDVEALNAGEGKDHDLSRIARHSRMMAANTAVRKDEFPTF